MWVRLSKMISYKAHYKRNKAYPRPLTLIHFLSAQYNELIWEKRLLAGKIQ